MISLLDAKADGSALYRGTYAVVVNTCGPTTPAPITNAQPPSRGACHDLAAAMVDLIEDGKMNTRKFAQTRGRFAQACPPR